MLNDVIPVLCDTLKAHQFKFRMENAGYSTKSQAVLTGSLTLCLLPTGNEDNATGNKYKLITVL